jgi:hypothetical protein
MKYLKQIKNNILEIIFIGLIATFFFIYFVIYMTPSRIAWYREMRNQIVVFYTQITSVGK